MKLQFLSKIKQKQTLSQKLNFAELIRLHLSFNLKNWCPVIGNQPDGIIIYAMDYFCAQKIQNVRAFVREISTKQLPNITSTP